MIYSVYLQAQDRGTGKTHNIWGTHASTKKIRDEFPGLRSIDSPSFESLLLSIERHLFDRRENGYAYDPIHISIECCLTDLEDHRNEGKIQRHHSLFRIDVDIQDWDPEGKETLREGLSRKNLGFVYNEY